MNTEDIHEYYMACDSIRLAARGPFLEMLCIGCLEALLLWRQLVPDDFAPPPLNTDRGHRSPRLLERLGRGGK